MPMHVILATNSPIHWDIREIQQEFPSLLGSHISLWFLELHPGACCGDRVQLLSQKYTVVTYFIALLLHSFLHLSSA